MPIQESGTTQLSYNGYRFTVYKSKITGKPVYVDSGRTVKWMQWTIQVDGLVYADNNQDTTDADLQVMRRALSKNAGKLKYERKGFGKFSVNISDVWDVNFGPKPQLFNFVVIGNNKAAYVSWQCEVAIPECEGATFRNGLAAFEYVDEYSLHKTGLQTVTLKGYIEIPMTKRAVNDPRPPDHINNYRGRVDAIPPAGFQPTSRTWVVSPDKRRADFNYVYEQLPRPLHAGATEEDITHTYESELKGGGFVTWKGIIQGSITLGPNQFSDLGLFYFMQLVTDRLAFAGPAAINGPLPPGTAPRNTILIDKISISESIFGLQTRYAVYYRLIIPRAGVGNVNRILQIAIGFSGLWQPLRADVSFENWRNAQRGDSLNLRGSSGIEVDNSQETLIDLCLPEEPDEESLWNGEEGDWQEEDAANPDQPGAGPPVILPLGANFAGDRERYLDEDVLGDADNTNFLEYKIYLDYREEGNRYAWNQPTGNTLTELGVTEDVSQLSGEVTKNEVISSIEMGSPGNVHEVAAPQPIVRLIGLARRYNAQIPLPRLVRLGGQDAYFNRVVQSTQSVEEVHNGLPLHFHVFAVEYYLAGTPSQNILPPSNPYVGYDASRST